MPMMTPTYLVCYDVAEPKRQAMFRHFVRQFSVSYQYSAYECQLSRRERQSVIEFFLNHAVLSADACGVIRTQKIYWRTLPKSPIQTRDLDHFLYIG